MSIVDRISIAWDIAAKFGVQLVSSGVVEGIANPARSASSVLGVGRWDINTLRQCVRNSLDTNVITGVTLEHAPGKEKIRSVFYGTSRLQQYTALQSPWWIRLKMMQ